MFSKVNISGLLALSSYARLTIFDPITLVPGYSVVALFATVPLGVLNGKSFTE